MTTGVLTFEMEGWSRMDEQEQASSSVGRESGRWRSFVETSPPMLEGRL